MNMKPYPSHPQQQYGHCANYNYGNQEFDYDPRQTPQQSNVHPYNQYSNKQYY